MCVCAPLMCLEPMKPEEDTGSPRTGVTDGPEGPGNIQEPEALGHLEVEISGFFRDSVVSCDVFLEAAF